jgi:hypothetical protein
MTDEPQDPDAPLGERHEPSAELVRRQRLGPANALISSDDEMRRCWRLASALHASGMFKVGQAEQAFAKILIGRDIGISPTQALMSIDIVQGSIFMRGVLLASFVRRSEGYDYKIMVQTEEKCVVEFQSLSKATGEWRVDGESEFTIKEAAKQGLTNKDPWKKTPKNMLFWRAISNGVKFYCPDLLGGVPVYTEADHMPEVVAQLGAGTGTGEPEGIDLGPEVERVIERATQLGHARLSDRASIEVELGDQPPAKIAAWVREANAILAAGPARPLADAEVVSDA